MPRLPLAGYAVGRALPDGLRFAEVGTWWGAGDVEIDVVAVDERNAVTAVGSCKWTGDAVGIREYDALRRGITKAKLDREGMFWFLFSRSGFNAPLMELAGGSASDGHLTLVSLADLYAWARDGFVPGSRCEAPARPAGQSRHTTRSITGEPPMFQKSKSLTFVAACTGAFLGTVTVAFAVRRQAPPRPKEAPRATPLPLPDPPRLFPPRHPPPLPVPPFIMPRQFPAAVSVKSVSVEAVVRGGVAETEVTHVFRNDGEREAEGDFVFPIPAGASVSSFAMYDGEKKMEARLLEEGEATSTYEEIVRRRKDPALLTFSGRAALRARLFPIPPHSERKITLKLVTVLPREGDAHKYAWTLIGAYLPGQTRPQSVSVKVTVADGAGNLYSPTHDVQTRREGGQVVATWSADKNSPGTLTENPEFDLYITPKPGAGNVALSMLTYNAALPNTASLAGGARQSGYFLVVASPTVARPDAETAPRRVVVVMDRSGSMQGKKIEQAKSAIRFALGKLRPQDTFNVITFSDAVEKFAPEPLAATSANRERANAFIDGIVADGGTNIHDALMTGLAQFPEKGSGNTLLFFTDGLPTVGVTNQNGIIRDALAKNAKNTRTFFFGVGYDVDVPFLDSAAQSLRGDADYVRPDEDIEAKTSRFVAKTSSPVLENLHLTVEHGAAITGEIYPKPGELPDLFAGGQLVLVGRYTGAAKAMKLTLTGEANGKPQSFTLTSSLPEVDTSASFLPRLWANRKIGYLLDEVRLKEDGPAKKEAIDQIIALSKEWGILTPYTALFVPEPLDGFAGGGQPRPIPMGVAGGFGTGAYSAPSRGGRQGGMGVGDSVTSYGMSVNKSSASASLGASVRSGESAVNVSQSSRAQRNAAQVGNVYAYQNMVGADRAENEAVAKRVQNVNQRTFVQNGAQWADATYDAKKQKQIVKVKLYSPAYFALTRRNADFARWAALGSDVLIAANATQAVQFAATGKETLTGAEVTALAGK